MSIESSIAISNALGRAAGAIPQLMRQEEEYQLRKKEHQEDRDWQRKGRDRQAKSWEREDVIQGRQDEAYNDQQAANEAIWDEHIGELGHAAHDEDPTEAMAQLERDHHPDYKTPETEGPGALGTATVATGGKTGTHVIPGKLGASAKADTTTADRISGKGTTPGKTPMGGGIQSFVLQQRLDEIKKKYPSMRGRAGKIINTYNQEIAAANGDPAKVRAAKVKASTAWASLKPKFTEMDQQFQQTQQDLMLAKWAKSQGDLMQDLLTIPVDPAQRELWAKGLEAKYGDKLKAFDLDLEALKKAKVYQDVVKIGDGKDALMDKGDMVIDNNGQIIPVGAMAMLATNTISSDQFLKMLGDYRKERNTLRIQAQVRGQDMQFQEKMARIAASGQARANQNPYKAELQEQVAIKNKIFNLGWSNADETGVDWNKVPKDKASQQKARELEQQMQIQHRVLGNSKQEQAERKQDFTEKIKTYQVGQEDRKAALKAALQTARAMGSGRNTTPQQQKQMVDYINKTARELNLDPQQAGRHILDSLEDIAKRSGVTVDAPGNGGIIPAEPGLNSRPSSGTTGTKA